MGPPLAAYFERHGFELQQATRPSVGLALLQAGGFDAAILDVMLPEMDGFELCRQIRRASPLPLLMLTARGDVMDRVVGLELGADGYLFKPFEPRELLVRLQTVLRRTALAVAPAPAGLLRFEGLQIDLVCRRVQRHGELAELTSTEFEWLVLLSAVPGKVHSRDDILARLRGCAAKRPNTSTAARRTSWSAACAASWSRWTSFTRCATRAVCLPVFGCERVSTLWR